MLLRVPHVFDIRGEVADTAGVHLVDGKSACVGFLSVVTN